ncbi:MAG TPA: Fur family transcriptional regulator [Phycisphaeraceae bacterium]
MSQSPQPPAPEADLILPLCAIFRRFLKRKGLKFTTERAMILNAVLNKAGVFEAEELFEEMRAASHRVSKATIYRTLKHLREANIISEVLIDSRHAHYQLSFGREDKGLLVCLETNQIIEFAAPELAKLRDRICQEHGFEPVSFRFVVYGVSPEARRQEQAEDETDTDTPSLTD